MGEEARRVSGRVLHATLGFGDVSETFIVDRMVELDRLGWEAWVAAKWMVDDAEFEFPPAARVLSPRPRDRAARLLSRRGRRETWWLERPIAKVGPALIHAHFGWTAREALPAARDRGIPLVAGFHGYDATVFPHYGFDAHDEAGPATLPPGVYDDLFRHADGILATSEFIASKLRALGCDREIDVVPSGIRLELFPFRGRRPGGAAGELRIVFIGRLVPYKGLDTALRAVAELAGRGAPPNLSVIGDGPARDEYERLAASLGVAHLVDFRGAQPRASVPAALREADVLVLPSRTTPAGQAEGLGNVVKEALAVGLEVAITDNGGLREVMPPDRRDELVPEGDAEGLAARLEAIERARRDWPARARDGRRWVEEAFDWGALAPRIDAVYRRVAGRGR
jgi:glycosyltransferase involved in cell wall biosynthesis